jgi:hypothetical protein
VDNFLEQYYRGITQRLRAEVDFINALFRHPGVKGEGNEKVLRDFLTKFIPKQYGIDTGIVIDRDGNSSGQCDVVIYDDLSYPAFFFLTASHFFPIDTVRVVIEVKTTIDSSKAKEACKSIAAVRKLPRPDPFGDPPTLSRLSQNGKRVYENWRHSPPSGCVFAYKSDVKRFESFKNWFTPSKKNDKPKYFPTLIGCLDQGIVRYRDTDPLDGSQPEGYTCPVRDESGNIVEPTKPPGEWEKYDRTIYPVKQIGDRNILVDQSRVFLLFALYLFELIRIKEPSPKIEMPIHYLNTIEQSVLQI